MNLTHSDLKAALRGALLGLVAGIAVSQLPMHMPERSMNILSAILALSIMVAASAAWGYRMGRQSGSDKAGRMALAGGLSFAPALILAAMMLSRLEVAIVERGGGPDLPVHVVFTLLFVPAAFLVTGAGGFALGLAQGRARLAVKMGISSALAGGLAFLIVNLAMDALGWRVGAPGAERRFTMITVMMVSNLGAALAGGAVIGTALRRHVIKDLPAPVPHWPGEAGATPQATTEATWKA